MTREIIGVGRLLDPAQSDSPIEIDYTLHTKAAPNPGWMVGRLGYRKPDDMDRLWRMLMPAYLVLANGNQVEVSWNVVSPGQPIDVLWRRT